jgi:hypothetical protein
MNKATRVRAKQEAELRRNFEFAAYLMITQYLAKTHGFEELHRFAKFWAEMAAEGRRKIIRKSRKEFLDFEAKVEKVWVDRDVERLDENGYVGLVEACPLRETINNNRGSLPEDYFCDYICATIYPEGYRLLGLKGSIKKTEKGCTVEIAG